MQKLIFVLALFFGASRSICNTWNEQTGNSNDLNTQHIQGHYILLDFTPSHSGTLDQLTYRVLENATPAAPIYVAILDSSKNVISSIETVPTIVSSDNVASFSTAATVVSSTTYYWAIYLPTNTEFAYVDQGSASMEFIAVSVLSNWFEEDMTAYSYLTQSVWVMWADIQITETGACEDPHFFGWGHQKYDFNGIPGNHYNLLSDTSIQLNALFTTFDDGATTWMTHLGLSLTDPSTLTTSTFEATPSGSFRLNGDEISAPAFVSVSRLQVAVNSNSVLLRTAQFEIEIAYETTNAAACPDFDCPHYDLNLIPTVPLEELTCVGIIGDSRSPDFKPTDESLSLYAVPSLF